MQADQYVYVIMRDGCDKINPEAVFSSIERASAYVRYWMAKDKDVSFTIAELIIDQYMDEQL